MMTTSKPDKEMELLDLKNFRLSINNPAPSSFLCRGRTEAFIVPSDMVFRARSRSFDNLGGRSHLSEVVAGFANSSFLGMLELGETKMGGGKTNLRGTQDIFVCKVISCFRGYIVLKAGQRKCVPTTVLDATTADLCLSVFS
jgi:hypothetical protein